jgi:hypothetical protein
MRSNRRLLNGQLLRVLVGFQSEAQQGSGLAMAVLVLKMSVIVAFLAGRLEPSFSA